MSTATEFERIDRRLSLAFLALGAALILLFGAAFGFFVLHSIHEERDRLSSTPARLLAPGLTAAKAAGQFRMQQLAEDMRRTDPSILYVRVTDPTGALVQEGPTPDADEVALARGERHGDVRLRELVVDGQNVTEASIPLVGGYDGTWHGVLRLGVRLEPEAAVARRVVLGAVLLLLAFLGLAWPIARWFGRSLGSPVQRLARDLSGLLEHTSLYLVIEDEEHRVVRASDTFRRGFGADCQGKSVRAVLGLDPGARLDGEIEVRVQGVPRTLHLVYFPIEFAPDGRPLRSGIVGTDVTEFRQAELERLRLAAAIEATDDCVMLVEAGKGILYANPALLTLSGLVPGEVLGQDPLAVLPADDEGRATLGGRAPAEAWRGRLRAQRRGAAPWQCALSIAPIEGAGFEVWVARDVSREVDLETQLRQSQKLEAIGQLAGGVAHDFNNLLTVVLSNTQSLLDDPLTAEQRESITMIDEAGQRASELTRQLLAFGRRQVLKVQEVNLGDTVERSIALLRRVIGTSIELKTEIPPGLWPIKADPGQLEQVLMNLAINARDAMPQGGTLVVGLTNATLDGTPTADGRTVPHGDYVVLRVGDTGSGMSAETLTHIFEPFFTTKAAGRGTGLGLATVLGIVRQSGAFIWVLSEPSRGSVFRIAFPRAPEAQAVTERPAEPELPRGHGEHVLLVEDEPLVRRVLEQMLSAAGYQVTTAGNGVEAMALLEKDLAPDVVLTDIVMPRMGGLDLRRLVRERWSMPVLLMSGYSAEVVELGGVDDAELLWKPPSRAAVLAALQRALR